MKKIIYILLLLMPLLSYSQSNLYVESVVIEDDTEVPVAEAKVRIEDVDLTTHTDENGFFSFKQELPEGDYVISVSKEGYDTKIFLVKQRKGFKIKLKEVRVNVVKKEAKRRKKRKKEEEKLLKKKLKEVEKKRKKKDKKLEKQKKRLLKENTVLIEYDSIAEKKPIVEIVEEKSEPEVVQITENQKKYAGILGLAPLELSNKELYSFIDDWMGTPYLWGGETKEAIDCSSFTQRLFIKAYDMYLERTAQKQCDSKSTELFDDLTHLNEGDLLFFGKDQFNIVHVGVYLHNNKFVHATSRTVDGPAGVKISDLKNPYWTSQLMSAGRRKKVN